MLACTLYSIKYGTFQGNRTLSDGLEIYQAMIEDTMQSVKPELIEAMQNYKVSVA